MINVFEPKLSVKDKFSVMNTLLKNNISGTSPVINEFEELSSIYFNRKYSVALSNGSTALDVAFQLLELSKKDEVIVPSFTIISCLSAIIRSGAKPIFCDVDPSTWNMTLDEVEKKYNKNTKAVLMVHTYGLPTEATKIAQFCKDKNIYLIEDAAEAHGQTEGGVKCGSFGDISTLSFYANKHITTGEGGMLLTNSEIFYSKAKQMINLDFDNNKRFAHNNLYWNYRLSGLQASLGISQLKQINKTINKKIQQGLYYSKLLSNYNNKIQLPLNEHNGEKNHFWVYGVVIKNSVDRKFVMEELYKNGIQTRPFFWPLHLQKSLPYKYQTKEVLKNSEKLGTNGFYLPIGSHVTKKHQRFISSTLISIL